MGTIDTALVTQLKTAVDLFALVGNRIYPWPAPDKTTGFDPFPCLAYWQVHGKRSMAMAGANGIVVGEYQIDILAEDSATARQVADEVRICLNGWRGTSDGVTIDYVQLDDEDADPFATHMPTDTKWIEQYYSVWWREDTT